MDASKSVTLFASHQAFDMWMSCHSQQEIADMVGYSKPAIVEVTNSLQSVKNGTDAENDLSSENPELTITREFDEQKAREFTKLKEIEAERAKKNLSDAGKGLVNLPKVNSREDAAAKVGMSGKTAEKAAEVVQVIDAMEQTGETGKDYRSLTRAATITQRRISRRAQQCQQGQIPSSI